jgi:hypothetical protein
MTLVVFDHRADGGAVIEMLNDVVNVFRKAIDVGAKVFFE